MKNSRLSACLIAFLAMASSATSASRGQDSAASNPRTESFVYKSTKQGPLSLFVHFPAGWNAGDKRPAIVFFFGGGWTSGKITQFEPQAIHLAGRGMVAIRADYRVKSRHGVSPPDCVQDAKSAIRYVRAHAAELGIDPDRIIAAGGSAGGHIAACTSLCPGLEATDEDPSVSSKPNALVLFNPVLQFLDVPQLAGRLDNNQETARLISPTLHLSRDTPPTLLFFGTADRLLAQGTDFVKKAQEVGCKVQMHTAEGQPHGYFNRPPWQEKTTGLMDEFLVSLGYLTKAPAP